MVTLQRDSCDRYESCGPYGNCYADDPNCRCLRGFTPKSPESWRLIDWSDGCVRKRGLDCQNGDGFVKYDRMKLPDNSHLVTNRNFSLSLEECEAECLKNCSCMAYTKIDIHGNGGDCVMWFGDLVDMKYFPNGGSNLYIRMAQAELGMHCQLIGTKNTHTYSNEPLYGNNLLFALIDFSRKLSHILYFYDIPRIIIH